MALARPGIDWVVHRAVAPAGWVLAGADIWVCGACGSNPRGMALVCIRCPCPEFPQGDCGSGVSVYVRAPESDHVPDRSEPMAVVRYRLKMDTPSRLNESAFPPEPSGGFGMFQAGQPVPVVLVGAA